MQIIGLEIGIEYCSTSFVYEEYGQCDHISGSVFLNCSLLQLKLQHTSQIEIKGAELVMAVQLMTCLLLFYGIDSSLARKIHEKCDNFGLILRKTLQELPLWINKHRF